MPKTATFRATRRGRPNDSDVPERRAQHALALVLRAKFPIDRIAVLFGVSRRTAELWIARAKGYPELRILD